jgi:CBS domain-containing protein
LVWILTFGKVQDFWRRVLIPNVDSIMSHPVETINDKATVLDAIDLMIDEKVGSLVVMNLNKPIGIFTRRDFYRAVKQRLPLSETNIRTLMSAPIVTIGSHDDVQSLIRVMQANNVTRAVVVDGTQLVGIVTETDIQLQLPRHQRTYAGLFKRYAVDTLAYIMFWSGITILIQVYLVGISYEQFLTSSLLGFLVTLGVGGVYGRFLDLLRKKFEV